MPSESIEALIFKPYFSTTDSVSEISGRGIGLSILEENVKRLGGRIELVSVLAQGTSITMTFPTPKYL
jgi:two-component system chemotaxis sensor kinase CheA